MKNIAKYALLSVLCTILVLYVQNLYKEYQQYKESIPLPCFVVDSGKIQFVADAYHLQDGCVVFTIDNAPEKVCCGACMVVPYPRNICDLALFELSKSELPKSEEK
jgi:hypothetical protein